MVGRTSPQESAVTLRVAHLGLVPFGSSTSRRTRLTPHTAHAECRRGGSPDTGEVTYGFSRKSTANRGATTDAKAYAIKGKKQAAHLKHTALSLATCGNNTQHAICAAWYDATRRSHLYTTPHSKRRGCDRDRRCPPAGRRLQLGGQREGTPRAWCPQHRLHRGRL
eukprot:scaffold63012_cov54-Phaeocystis_antarctica.AAC.2